MKGHISMFFRWLKYKINARHYKGHGLHSPFAYQFVSQVVYSTNRSREIDEIENTRKGLNKSKKSIPNIKIGSGSRLNSGDDFLGNWVKKTAISRKCGLILFHSVRYFNPEIIIELGTSVGISTLYLSRANPEKELITVEGREELATTARNLFSNTNLNNIEVKNLTFSQFFDIYLFNANRKYLIFIDGDHSYNATMYYINHLLKVINNHSVILIHDIHWSDEMEKSWQEIKNLQQVHVTFDFFELGVIVLRDGLQKQNYTVKI